SSVLLLLCWMATGKMAATRIKPMPRIMTAKRTSAKFIPRCRRRKPGTAAGWRGAMGEDERLVGIIVGSFAGSQGPVVAVDDQDSRVVVQWLDALLSGGGEIWLEHAAFKEQESGLGVDRVVARAGVTGNKMGGEPQAAAELGGLIDADLAAE